MTDADKQLVAATVMNAIHNLQMGISYTSAGNHKVKVIVTLYHDHTEVNHATKTITIPQG